MKPVHLTALLIIMAGLSACDMSVGGGGVMLEGKQAPSVHTSKLSDVGGDMAKLTSYRYPDPKMYQYSFDEALKMGKPIVLEFATPGHCTQCDQQLQLLKAMMKKYGDAIIFLHMDQYYNPQTYPELFMNRRDDCAEPLFATDSEERGRSYAYGRPARDSVRTKEQASARQYL